MDRFDFMYQGGPVGYFKEAAYPLCDGRYRYEPYRNWYHYAMHEARRHGIVPRCYYDDGQVRVSFSVRDCREYEVLDLFDFNTKLVRPICITMTLRDILCQTEMEQPDAWLYLHGDVSEWTLDTAAFLLNPQFESGQDEPILAASLRYKGLREAMDTRMIIDCVRWADRLAGCPDDDVRLESFLYYVRFDAFLPKIGAPNPPPNDENRQRLDAEFYYKLGVEDSTRPCRHDGCNRGAIRFSVLCKRHHFEMIKHYEFPGSD